MLATLTRRPGALTRLRRISKNQSDARVGRVVRVVVVVCEIVLAVFVVVTSYPFINFLLDDEAAVFAMYP